MEVEPSLPECLDLMFSKKTMLVALNSFGLWLVHPHSWSTNRGVSPFSGNQDYFWGQHPANMTVCLSGSALVATLNLSGLLAICLCSRILRINSKGTTLVKWLASKPGYLGDL